MFEKPAIVLVIVFIIILFVMIILNIFFLYQPVDHIQKLVTKTTKDIDKAIIKVDKATEKVDDIANKTSKLENKINTAIDKGEKLAVTIIEELNSEFVIFKKDICQWITELGIIPPPFC